MHVAIACPHAGRMSSPRLTRGRHSRQNAVYAVTMATHHRQPLFQTPALANVVHDQLHHCDREGISQTHAWVAMPDHLHWLFTLREDDLSACLRRFKSRCARAINTIRRVSGPVWQSGFYDHRLRDDEDLRVQARYVVANPLRAGLVADIREYTYWGCQWISRHAGFDDL
ncbi:transposase [Stenotrophomonas sp. NLF4-10]|uniref:REP-associated tyrosine transposase n=1 Tax=Stenotrophomonas sp. NLF4-10 TaxID=2918754 RepID=UPI001EFB747E|nr:transposase [Stenotrophomonas sp. NLF4-10]MCG8277379.1 transposase [Stenotrophomonas sp. NLF4-10]